MSNPIARTLSLGILMLAGCAELGSGRLEALRSLSDTSWGYLIVDDLARAGTYSQRFEVRPGDCGIDRRANWSDCENDRERSEVNLAQSWRHGEEVWIGFSVFVPTDFATSTRVRTTVGQISQKGGPRGTAGGLPSFPPLIQMEMQGGRYVLRVHVLSGSPTDVQNDARDFELIGLQEMRGRWTDLAINLDTSDENQALRVYVNGDLRAEISDWMNFIPQEYLFKYGIYRSFVSRHGGPLPTQILYIDEVRTGDSLADVVVNEREPVD